MERKQKGCFPIGRSVLSIFIANRTKLHLISLAVNRIMFLLFSSVWS